MLGRTINEDDDRPNAPDVVVMSHRLWQTRFGGDRNVVGRFIQLNDTPTQVIGVMPPGFRFVYHDIDAWVPLQLDRNAPWRENGGRFINVVARVKAGTGIATARADMEQVARRLASIHEFNKNGTARLVPLREELTGQVEASLIVLYVAVGVLLAIACFNIANLLIARAASRRQEIAIRTSLGLRVVRSSVSCSSKACSWRSLEGRSELRSPTRASTRSSPSRLRPCWAGRS